jgi:recombination protein RecT
MGRLAGTLVSGARAVPAQDGERVEPVRAASVILLRGNPFEILMLRRNEKSSFVPSAWVFPGGIVEPSDADVARAIGDDSDLATLRVAAARETFEESGVWLGAPLARPHETRRALLDRTLTFSTLAQSEAPALERLVLTSRWITPVGLPKRFDTWFFLAEVAEETEASPEQMEAVETLWIRPELALAQQKSGAMQMVFPTIRNLMAIAAFASAGDLIAARRDAVIEPVLPVLVDGKPTLAGAAR